MMRSVRCVSFLLLFASSVFAQVSGQPKEPSALSVSPQRDATALLAIQQSLSTMGLIASPTLRTRAQGTVTSSDGTTQPISMETAGVDRVRNDLGNGDFVFVANAGQGFVSAKGIRHHLSSWATQYKRADHLPALSLMADVLNPSLQIQLVGIENVNGSAAYHIRLAMLPSDSTPVQIEDLISEFHVYIDQTSMLVVRTQAFDFSPDALQNRTPVDTFFSDYRNVSGVLVPFHLIRYIAGHNQSDITFTTVSLNAAVPDSDFE